MPSADRPPEDDFEGDEDGIGEFRPPLPPEDRVWRHPSEVAATRRAPGVHVSRTRLIALVAVSAAVGASVAVGLVGAFVGIGQSGSTDGRLTALTTVDDVTSSTVAAYTSDRVWLGVRGTDPDDDAQIGAMVVEVMGGSPAERAGIRAGDLIVELGGHTIDGIMPLVDAVGRRGWGESVEIVLHRHGEVVTITAILDYKPDDHG